MALPRGSLRRALRPGAPPTPEPSFAELFAASPVAILLLDPEERVVRANAACEHLLNHSERAMAGQSLDNILTLPEEWRDRRGGHGFAAFDIELGVVRGPRVRVDFFETLLADRPGWRMITLLHAAGGRWIGQGIDRSAGARAAIGAAAMLAHEIKNPLSGIRGAAQLLATGPEDPEELTTLITHEVDRIAALIDRMQDFTDTRPLNLQPANIYPLLAHVRRVAQSGFAREILIEERFDPSLPSVRIDRDGFLQLMLNLLKNAAEALENTPSPRIIVSTAYRHGMSVSAGPGQPRQPLPIEITVADNGPGAPDDIADHLFDPFVSGKPEGQGLGLPLVDKLVRGMGGIVQYAREGEPRQTVFRVLLPRGDA